MKLPPMNALRAFESVSRHLSVSKAAEEMCVSQGAVSQQVRNLEEHVGQALFVRSNNRLTLTAEGELFATVVQQSLMNISIAAKDIVKSNQILKIHSMSTFSVKWLLPRMEKFYKLYPDITISLDYDSIQSPQTLNGLDGAIRFGDGNFGELDSIRLIQIKFYAVASKSYIAKYGSIDDMTKPRGHILIDFSNYSN